MKSPKVKVMIEMYPINPENLPEEDRTEEKYKEIMMARLAACYNLQPLLVNQVFTNTIEWDFPEGWNK